MAIGRGMKEGKQKFSELVKGAGEGCAWGVPSGDNFFQQEDPSKILEAICFLVHQGARVYEAWNS